LNKNKFIHIVAFDIPYPPNYGGIIDIFYKIKALKEKGFHIILHVYLYAGKEPSDILKQLCHKVYYYNRRRFANPFIGELPYIVSTRNGDELLNNLLKDKHPILFEGLHTTYFLNHKSLEERFKIVRTHNVEHLYYKALEEAETGFFKKYFFRVESERLAQYEMVLKHADLIATISPAETEYYQTMFPQTSYVPAFHGNEEVSGRLGQGKYLLYHGNLGVGENNKAALYLVHEISPGLDIPVVIAGNNPSRQLKQAVKGNPYINLVSKISSEDILELVAEAQINLLVTFQSTGIKLKLLNALYRGRHCVVNPAMVENTGLDSICHMASKPLQLQRLVKSLWTEPFTETDLEHRKEVLLGQFSNRHSAEMLTRHLGVETLSV